MRNFRRCWRACGPAVPRGAAWRPHRSIRSKRGAAQLGGESARTRWTASDGLGRSPCRSTSSGTTQETHGLICESTRSSRSRRRYWIDAGSGRAAEVSGQSGTSGDGCLDFPTRSLQSIGRRIVKSMQELGDPLQRPCSARPESARGLAGVSEPACAGPTAATGLQSHESGCSRIESSRT